VAVVSVRVTPGASAARIGPFADGVLHIRVSRPPADGQATEAARRLLARTLGVPPSSVLLQAGARSRTKRFEAVGLSEAAALARLRHLERPPD
jgi:uncharacterized protein YggU (UPF0235/DUF167 family)